MRRVCRRLALGAVVLLPLPVLVGVMAPNSYAATGCYERPLPAPPPDPLGDVCVVTVALGAEVRYDVRVAVRTVEGTARAGEDFVAVDEILILPAGESGLAVRVAIVPDGDVEPEEQFSVLFELSAPDLEERVETAVTILDGEPEPPR